MTFYYASFLKIFFLKAYLGLQSCYFHTKSKISVTKKYQRLKLFSHHRRVPDQPGAFPAHPLPSSGVLADRVHAERVARGHHSRRADQRLLRGAQPDGEVPE